MEEVWKDIGGYEGLYQVSNLGRIKSLDRRTMKWKIKALGFNGKNKYLQVSLYKNNIEKRYLVHRLVAQAFIPNLYNKETINHKDGNKQNNNVNNLEWATRSENSQHAFRTGLAHNWLEGKRGKDNYQSKIILQIDKNTKKIIGKFYGLREASEKTGVHESDICNCCNNKKGHYTAGGYIWRYKEEQ